jgi:hypothetical protein
LFAEIEAEYLFSYHAAEGRCTIRFGFPKYFMKHSRNIEFEINIESVSLKGDYSHVNKERVRLHLLKKFEKMKLEQYQWFKAQALEGQCTPPN